MEVNEERKDSFWDSEKQIQQDHWAVLRTHWRSLAWKPWSCPRPGLNPEYSASLSSTILHTLCVAGALPLHLLL